jgi:5-methylcytosine-specific restriction protein A
LDPAAEPIVKREYLIGKYPPRLAWDTQQSGIRIKPDVAVRLRRDWEQVADPPTVSEEVSDDPDLWEGATRQIRVNTYERSPEARRKCLDIHGHECAACHRSLVDTYGPLAERLIDVHHVRPLSSIGAEYRIDPERDLRPVCPNCHAVIHRCSEDGTPLTIEYVQQLLAEHHRA